MAKKKLLIVVAIMLMAGLGYSGYFLITHNNSNPLTISELRSQAPSLYDQPVTIRGQITPGTVNWDNRVNVMTFTLNDNMDSLTAVYTGMVPDNFKLGTELVVEGIFRSDGVFEIRSFGRPNSVCNLCH